MRGCAGSGDELWDTPTGSAEARWSWRPPVRADGEPPSLDLECRPGWPVESSGDPGGKGLYFVKERSPNYIL